MGFKCRPPLIPPEHGLSGAEVNKLKKAIRSFIPAATTMGCATRYGAYGKCNTMSDMFLHELEKVGLEGLIEAYEFADKRGPCTQEQMDQDRMDYPFHVDIYDCAWHWAVRVGNIVIDWTAKQFNRAAPFPAIWFSEKRPWRNCED